MTQALYAHMNNKKIKINKKRKCGIYLYTMEFYSVMKNEILSFAGK
jgi:hypothetical protein